MQGYVLHDKNPPGNPSLSHAITLTLTQTQILTLTLTLFLYFLFLKPIDAIISRVSSGLSERYHKEQLNNDSTRFFQSIQIRDLVVTNK